MSQKSRRKIIEKGLESAEMVNTFSDKEVVDYLFEPSFKYWIK